LRPLPCVRCGANDSMAVDVPEPTAVRRHHTALLAKEPPGLKLFSYLASLRAVVAFPYTGGTRCNPSFR